MTEDAQGWQRATVAGFRAMAEQRYAQAAACWLGAQAGFAAAPGDPLAAASRTNAGAAHLLAGRLREAEAMLADAERSWTGVLRRLAVSEVPLPGASSSFHFRLAARNLEAFEQALRHRHVRRCEAALAITRFNLLLASARPAANDAIVTALAAELADILGPRAPDVRLLRAADFATDTADSLYAEKVAEVARGAEEGPAGPPGDDVRRLGIAVALTALVRPGLVRDVQSEAEAEWPAGRSLSFARTTRSGSSR